MVLSKLALGQYRFDQWTADNGLPQNSIYSIMQTRDGYLWLATVDGLARFDGVRFTIFNKSNSSGIINNRFTSLFEDVNGDLWAGTEESGAIRYHNGQFTSYGVESGLNSPQVSQVNRDSNGNSLVLLANSQVYRFLNGGFTLFNNGTTSEQTTANYSESRPSFCFASTEVNQLTCLWNGQLAKLTLPAGTLNSSVIGSVQDSDRTFWLLTNNQRLIHLENGEITKVYTKKDGLPENSFLLTTGEHVNLLSTDQNENLWLTNPKTMVSELLAKHVIISLTDVHTAYEDREGNLWLGSLRDGLFRIRKQVITTFSKAQGLLDNNVYPIFEDHGGVVWVGTTKGVFKYQDGTFIHAKGSEKLYVDALGEDSSGRLLISSARTLSVSENDQIKNIFQSQFGEIWAVYTDRENALWLGCSSGLVRLQDNVATTFTTNEGLGGNNVKVIIDDQNGGMWIGSYGGLTHYKDGKFEKWTQSEGLPTLTIRSLYLDADNTLWIGSYDSGLARFKDGKFTHYDTKNGLFNDGAFQILEDDTRNFWLSSNRGIYRVRKDELNEFAEGKRNLITSIGYGKSDGMLSVEANGGRMPGGIKTRDGRLWFPTQDGVAVINPETVKLNPQPPHVLIEEIKIDNQTVSIETLNSVFSDSQSAIKIEPNQQNFGIQYTALSFINSENLRFRYKLEGLDSDWIDAGSRRTAYFSHIPAGNYTFRVIAANSDGVWNEQGASVKITILPPFYLTWWFTVLSVLTIAAAVYFLFKRRINLLERQRLAQQNFSRQMIASQEQERKRIAAELHDSLGQRLVVVKNLAWMFLNTGKGSEISHIEEISEEVSQALNEVKAISYNLRPYQLDRIGLTKAIEAVVRSSQTASGIDFSAEIDDIDDYFPNDAEINFYRIVQESVNNIIKHSQATEAKIEVKRADIVLNLTIKDNGHGFEMKDNQTQPNSSGFGLIGITERTQLLGGVVEIKSAVNEGTIIKITLKHEQ